LGKGRLLQEDVIKEIAKKYNKTPAQVLIRWSIQNDVVTIPKSIKQHRVYENMEVMLRIWLNLQSHKILFTISFP
jgi:diketogulonate reductase-like aldo/keto reductase